MDQVTRLYCNAVELTTCIVAWQLYDLKAAALTFMVLWVLAIRSGR